MADPLYVGLVTDTGRFGYSNTRARAHRLAATLIEAGVDPAEISRRLYEELPLDRLLLMGRALERARSLAGGRMLGPVLTHDDFEAAGGDDTEGIVEVMRGVRGVQRRRARSRGRPRRQLSGLPAGGRSRRGRRRDRRRGGRRRPPGGGRLQHPADPEDLLAWLGARASRPRLDGDGADG